MYQADEEEGVQDETRDESWKRKPGQEPRAYDRYARSVVDGLSAHVAVIEGSGAIVFTNEAWRGFARANGGAPAKDSEGANYLEACDAATGADSESAAAFAVGIRDVLHGRRTSFELEYPCHTPERRRWFVGRVTRLPGSATPRAVVAHEEVTDRKLYEEERARRRLHEALARARTHEQRRIGRELHDRVGQLMALVHQSLELHEYFEGRDPGKAAEKMDLAKRATREALEATRDLSRVLSVAEAEGGLQVALSELLRDLATPWIAHEVSVEGDESSVPPEVGEQLFLILREAVRNALAHSGCERLAVRLRLNGEEAIGVVEDDGTGFGPEETRQEGAGGLDFMAERAVLVGGTCRIDPSPLGGTRVEVIIPLRPTPIPGS